jgi:hypothetical protein
LATLLHTELDGSTDCLGQFLNADFGIAVGIKHLEDIDDILVTDHKVVNAVETSVELSKINASLVVLVDKLHPVKSNVIDTLLTVIKGVSVVQLSIQSNDNL